MWETDRVYDRNLTKGPISNIEVGLSKEKPVVWKVYSRRNKVGSGVYHDICDESSENILRISSIYCIS
ncbi:hypothetical protein Lal_00001345 [Lupinus albus]|nr:hypothetical protein Lal_00001345 [Lupinus albus]